MTFILVLMVALVCGAISMGIGSKKGYPHTFWWGFLLSIIGIKVVALKPYLMPFVLALVVALVCGAISQNIGSKKGYPHTFWWGFLLSIIGIKVVALKPYPPSDNQV